MSRQRVFFSLGLVLVGVGYFRANHSFESRAPTSAVWLVVDASRSMLTHDVSPDRIGAGRELCRELVANLQGRQIGLAIFGGDVRILAPPTHDLDFVEHAIATIEAAADVLPGSNFPRALAKLVSHEAPGRPLPSLVLITDGGQVGVGPPASLSEPLRAGKLVLVGVGRQDVLTPLLNDGLPLLEKSQPITSRCESDRLREYAQHNGGTYVPFQSPGATGRQVADFLAASAMVVDNDAWKFTTVILALGLACLFLSRYGCRQNGA